MSAPKYVYFIKPVGMDGPIKIGCSDKPETRLLALSAWSPFVLEIIGTTLGSCQDECFLHRRFADLHSHREWFRSSPLLRETIHRVLAGETIRSACMAIPVAGAIRNQKKRRPTPERQQFIDFGAKIRKAVQPLWNKQGTWYAPPDVRKIMDDWRGDYLHRKPVSPSPAQIARLNEFLSDPKRHCVFVEHDPTHSKPFDIALAEAAAKQAAQFSETAQ